MRLGPVWVADDLPEARAAGGPQRTELLLATTALGGAGLTLPAAANRPCTPPPSPALQVYPEKYRGA